ncbi:MAG: hypothetical protein LYZ66_04490 [Nitrososphaerales archaeon]|nr:hypothetical protein [Nitrososphaerales archaeon]
MSNRPATYPAKNYKYEILAVNGTAYYTDEFKQENSMLKFDVKAIRSPTESWEPSTLEVMVPIQQIMRINHIKVASSAGST